MGIDYKSDCLIGAENFYERLLCGNSWQQTNANKILFPSLLLVLIAVTAFIIYRFIKKRRR